MGCNSAAASQGGKTASVTLYTTADKTVEKIEPTEIKSVVGGNIRMGVYDAESKGNGEIHVEEAKFTVDEDSSSRKYSHRTYKTKGSYIDVGGDSDSYRDDRDATISKGVNWDNVKAVSGNAYNMRTFLKKKGFKWNSKEKRWEK